MNRTELIATRQALQKQLDALAPIKISCGTCAHLSSQRVCDLFDERPPSEAMINDIDCPTWEHDGLPF